MPLLRCSCERRSSLAGMPAFAVTIGNATGLFRDGQGLILPFICKVNAADYWGLKIQWVEYPMGPKVSHT